MIEQQGNALVFKAFFVASKIGKTGLTVTCDLYRNGSSVATAQAATEQGGGFYSYTLASGSVDAEGLYECLFKTSDTSVDQQHIPSLWVVGKAGVENLDAAVSTRATPAQVDASVAAVSGGTGSVQYTDTVEDTNGDGIEGVEVVVRSTSDSNSAIRARATTNSAGEWTVQLDPGTYYVWVQLSRYSASNPTVIEVTA